MKIWIVWRGWINFPTGNLWEAYQEKALCEDRIKELNSSASSGEYYFLGMMVAK